MAPIDEIRLLSTQLQTLGDKLAVQINALYNTLPNRTTAQMQDLPLSTRTELKALSAKYKKVAELAWNASYELPK